MFNYTQHNQLDIFNFKTEFESKSIFVHYFNQFKIVFSFQYCSHLAKIGNNFLASSKAKKVILILCNLFKVIPTTNMIQFNCFNLTPGQTLLKILWIPIKTVYCSVNGRRSAIKKINLKRPWNNQNNIQIPVIFFH